MTKHPLQSVLRHQTSLLAVLLLCGITAFADPIPAFKHGIRSLPAGADSKTPGTTADAPEGESSASGDALLSRQVQDGEADLLAEPETLAGNQVAAEQAQQAQPIPEPPSFLLVGVILLGVYAGHKSRQARHGNSAEKAA
jgi:hypothetical protein